MSRASIVSATNTQGRFLTKNDLQKASSYFQKAAASLEAAQLLTAKQEILDQELTQAVNEKFPDIASSFEFEAEEFILDIKFYIKIVSYCLVAGGTEPVDDYLLANLNGIKQYFSSLNLSFSRYIQAVKFILDYIKSNHGLSGQSAEETNKYIDYVVNALS